MTARPQQMSDGQEKSDDLIAELAKLMAGGSEAEAKPAPRLVSTPEAPRPAAPTFRIPGMDAPVPATPIATAPATPIAEKPAAPPVAPPPPVVSAPAPAAAPPVFRIPGMDRPVPVNPPVTEARPQPKVEPVIVPEPKPEAAAPRAPAIDFGPLTPPSAPRPQPLNWQDREVPRIPEPRQEEPKIVAPEPKAEFVPEVQVEARPEPEARVEPKFEPRAERRPIALPPEPLSMPEPVTVSLPTAEPEIVGRPQPEGDTFDFDFGFGGQPQSEPEAEAKAAVLPIEPEPAPAPEPSPTPQRPVEAPMPAAVARAVTPSTGDAIADLIAAELDAAEPVAPPAPQPAPVVARLPVEPRPRAANPVPSRPVAQPVPRAPVPRPSEPDNFGVAPMFGPAGRAAAAQAGDPLGVPASMPEPVAAAIASLDREPIDPMDEIESLIGEAVRVELTSNDRPVVAPIEVMPVIPAPSAAAPVVPPLTTGAGPRRANLKEAEPRVSSAEAAILAAAAAVGADTGRTEPRLDRIEPSPARHRAKAERRRFLGGGMRQYVGMAVAGTLLLAAGFGLYWVLGMNRATDADAPVLQADAGPVKSPAPAVTSTADQQGSVVFNEMDGTDKTPANEQLVSRDDSADTPIADVARPVGEDGDSSENELANRKVRTVTVRPDGTIVNGDGAVAGSEALPVDRPNVPDIPGADTQPSELLASVPNGDATPVPETPASTDTPITPSPGANIDNSIVPPIPMARPADRSALAGGGGSAAVSTPKKVVASADPAPLDLVPPANVGDNAVATSNSGGAFVQMSSQKSANDAKAAMASIQRQFGGVLKGTSLEIRRVDLGSKGVWYRVVAPAGSFQSATQLCANIKANGGDCVPGNG